MSRNLAPIALFTYNRPLHTRRTIEALRVNDGADQSALFIFSDGPREDASAAAVEEVRALARSVRGFKRVELIERPTNFGLAASIIDGVTRLVGEHGRVVVVEDDLVTSRYFLSYINDGLDLYEADDRVASIHGYLPPLRGNLPETFFLRGADCWGWATWRRSWKHFNPDAAVLLSKLRSHRFRHRFDYLGTFPNTSMLKGYLNGKNQSWAIRWHASAFVWDMLTLHPGRTLVRNIGLDGSGTHCSDQDDLNSAVADAPVQVKRIPVVAADDAWMKFQRFYVRHAATRLLKKVIGRSSRLGS